MLSTAGRAPDAPPAADLDPGRLFSPFDLPYGATLLVAISGGSDSTALLLLTRRFADRRPDLRLVAATVDHALRPGSAAEAEAVARLCAKLGVAHRTLRWTGDKPATGLAEAARLARYSLLAGAAREEGAFAMLVAHTANDQAETVLMRQARGGRRGLAGMAPATLVEGDVWLLRPLLGTRRASLRAFLGGEGVGWIDDPTNVDPRFERPRLRAGLDDSALVAALTLQRDEARRRMALGEAAAGLIARHASMPLRGLVRLDPDFLAEAPTEACVYAFRLVLAACGGTAQLPDTGRAAALLAGLAAGHGREALSRTVVEHRAGGLWLHRERRDLPAALTVAGKVVWDGRYVVTITGDPARLAPMGREAAQIEAIGTLPARPARGALAAEPSLLDASGRRRPAPAFPLVAPYAHFLPGFDLAPAAALAALFGAPALPPSPCRRIVAEA